MTGGGLPEEPYARCTEKRANRGDLDSRLCRIQSTNVNGGWNRLLSVAGQLAVLGARCVRRGSSSDPPVRGAPAVKPELLVAPARVFNEAIVRPGLHDAAGINHEYPVG